MRIQASTRALQTSAPDANGKHHILMGPDYQRRERSGDDLRRRMIFLRWTRRQASFFPEAAGENVWASAMELQTGRAVEIPKSAGGGRQWTVHNWWPMSYNPQTGLVTSDDRPPVRCKSGVESGESGVGLEGRLIAWDPVSQSARWSVESDCDERRSALDRGQSGLSGQGTGEFAAFARTAEATVVGQNGSAIESIPVTFSLKGEQYVITPVLGSDRGCLRRHARWSLMIGARPVRLLAFNWALPQRIRSLRCDSARSRAAKADGQHRNDSQGEVLYKNLFATDATRRDRREPSVGARWRDSGPSLHAADVRAIGTRLCWAARIG